MADPWDVDALGTFLAGLVDGAVDELARAIATSDWLTAHDAEVRREAWAEGVRDAAARIGVSPEGSLLDANPYARQEADR